MKTYSVYILKCSDGSYYSGITSNLEQRLVNHNRGKHQNSFTYTRRPVTLVFHAEFTDPEKAIRIEKQIKKWSRTKKEALIAEDYASLIELARKDFKK